MACYRDEWDWCTTHDVPWIITENGTDCASVYGIKRSDSIPAKMHEAIQEMHDSSSCDHSECVDDYDLKMHYVKKEEIIDLLDLIERGQFDAFDLNTWRVRVSPHESSFTPNWNTGARR